MKVSIIIPCYNVEHYIVETLSFAVNQSYKDIEIICVDDGSTDGTVDRIKEFIAETSVSIHLITQENIGACSARNIGISNASGTYFQFLDGDDLILRDKIRDQIELVLLNDLPDLVIGSYRRINEKGEVLSENYYSDKSNSNVWISLLRTDLGITSSNLFKRELFDTGISWQVDLKSSQEYKLMFEILKKGGRIIFDSKINTDIIVRQEGSISQTNQAEKWLRYVKLRVEILEYLDSNNIPYPKSEGKQILFDAIRTLYAYDNKSAIFFFKQNFDGSFIPNISSVTSRKYIQIFKILGFQKTEKLRSLLNI